MNSCVIAARAMVRLPLIAVAAGLLLIVSAAGCRKAVETPDAASKLRLSANSIEFPQENPQFGALQITEAQPQPRGEVRLTGRLTWNEDVTSRVFSPIAGRVEKVVARIGQHVIPGDDLALVRSPEFGQAQADYRKAAGDIVQSEKTVARVRALREHGAAAQKDLEGAEADYNRLSAEKQRAEARLRLLGATGETFSDLYHLSTPIAGIVVDRNINAGQELRSDIILAGTPQLAAPSFVITDPNRLWVQLDVPEHALAGLQPGQEVEVRTPAYPDDVFAGRLEVVNAFLDPLTRVARARVSLDNGDGRLKAEMYVNVQVRTVEDVSSQLAELPERAVIFIDGRHYVFVESAPRKFVRRPVTLVREGSGNKGNVVVQGVAARERVVSQGGLLMNELLSGEGGGEGSAATSSTTGKP